MLNPKPQRDAAISSSNMKPVKWVKCQPNAKIIYYLHPDLIAFFQVQRRLEGQRTHLMNGAVALLNITRPDSIPVQIKKRRKPNIRWRYKIRQSRKREKINSRSRGREYSRIPMSNSWHFPRSPAPTRTESEFLFCQMKNFSGRRNGRASIWRRHIQSISENLLINYRIKELDNCNWIIGENLKNLPASSRSLVKSQWTDSIIADPMTE